MEKFIGIRPSKTVAVERFVVIFYRKTLRAACAVCWQHAKPQRRMITSMIVIETTIKYIWIYIYDSNGETPLPTQTSTYPSHPTIVDFHQAACFVMRVVTGHSSRPE